MGASLTFRGRLPGVVCESALPISPENPLRLDVAAFVGFAERGPLDTPIAVEDISQYRAVFGNDLLLARTKQGGQPVFAHLSTAVQAFFDNGGRRCYVVRVAGSQAHANRFRMPGIVAWDSNERTFKTVIVPAAWVGRWSNSMGVGTQLRSDFLTFDKNRPPTWAGNPQVFLEVPERTTVVANDLLRLHFGGTGKPILFFVVDAVFPTGKAATTTRGIPVTVQAQPESVFAFTRNPLMPTTTPIKVEKQLGEKWETFSATLSPLEELPDLSDGYALRVTVSENEKVPPGELLRLTYSNGDILYFAVSSVDPTSSSPSEQHLLLKSRTPLWQLTAPNSVERLTPAGWQALLSSPLPPLDAQLGRDQKYTLRLPATENVQVGDLLRVTCTEGQVLFFPVDAVELKQEAGTLPHWWIISQIPLWEASQSLSSPTAQAYGELLQVDLLSFDLFIREGSQVEEVWRKQRFGTGPVGTGPDYWVDRLVSPPPANAAQATALQADRSQLNIPGLDTSRSSRLGAPLSTTDIASVSLPLYLPLGMSALPGPEEFARPLPETGMVDQHCPLASKDDLASFNPQALFLDARLANVGARDLLNEANALLYLNGGAPVEPLRALHSLLLVDEIGLLALPDLIHRGWHCEEPIPPEKQPSPREPEAPDWSCFQNCPQAQTPPPERQTPCGKPLPFSSPPEDEELPDIQQQLHALPMQEAPDEYQQDELNALLAVQQALVHFCAARADVLGILSLPTHFKRREALDWQHAFTTGIPDLLDGSVLSYMAVYHPWLQIREEVTPQLAPLRATPPDGTICGMIAAREQTRGPWIAPANVPLSGVVGLTPVLTMDDWAELFNAQINLIRQKPGQFTLLSTLTLSQDNQLVQISVRRLLIFLRKLAFRRGMRYVFETNDMRFRQRVQTSFEHTLTQMAQRGALQAFEVVTGSEVNTSNDYDNGRFLIALKVAPTLPIEFITVVLLRAGEGLLEVIER